MKIAIYTICKNEEKFVTKFMQNLKGQADYIVVADTGSTDGTVAKLRAEGATVIEIGRENIWVTSEELKKMGIQCEDGRTFLRFDVARNLSLDAVPEDTDVCLSLDLDEVLSPGWREHLEKNWKPETRRGSYWYNWNHKADGTPEIFYWRDKIHARKNYKWRHPVHECLYYQGQGPENWVFIGEIVNDHWADNSKPRSSYLPLLELSVKEDPSNDRNAHYFARELMYYGRWKESKAEFLRHLALPSAQWREERAQSMRYLANVCHRLNEHEEALAWYLRAVAEAPSGREPWVDLAQEYYGRQDFVGIYFATKKALAITGRPASYISQNYAWSEIPHDLLGIASYYLGIPDDARAGSFQAWRMNPNDPRLVKNAKWARFMEKGTPLPPKIIILWPTIRPQKMKAALLDWEVRAKSKQNWERTEVIIAVNTQEQRDQLSDFKNVFIVGTEHKGVTYAATVLSQSLRGRKDLLPGDIVILASDDFVPPSDWDEFVISELRGSDGCLRVDDGHDSRTDRACVTIPIMDFACLARLNYMIYNPIYKHLYSDNELFINLKDMNLISDVRDKGVIFEHQHWHNGKREQDEVDRLVYSSADYDFKIFQERCKLPLAQRLA